LSFDVGLGGALVEFGLAVGVVGGRHGR
jgi:hypothetical protein